MEDRVVTCKRMISKLLDVFQTLSDGMGRLSLMVILSIFLSIILTPVLPAIDSYFRVEM